MTRYQILYKLFYFFACILLGVLPANAQENTPDDVTRISTEEAFTQGCAECHIDVVAQWQDTKHATAFTHESVQAAANEEGSTCLACHSTGFQAFSGNFTHEGVTCEACHGTTPANHPDEAIAVNVTAETCADCHTTTFHEWDASAHGAAELECVSCHDPHKPGLRFATSDQLCVNCHEQDALEGYAHLSHTDPQCTDCHWHHGDLETEQHILTGSITASGHDAMVETAACIDCHENGLASNTNASAAEFEPISLVQIAELEAEVESVRAQGANVAAVRLIQGATTGIAFGAVLMFGFIRLRPGRRVQEDE